MHSRLVPLNHSKTILLNPQTQLFDLESYTVGLLDERKVYNWDVFHLNAGKKRRNQRRNPSSDYKTLFLSSEMIDRHLSPSSPPP
ncbi:hypothetical protein MJO28_016958 [Puccinia striiformis f. sp. tritici]|nr:hypothetical protein MJO28_016958 [Puccinia striiformis f. sp. tritici]